MNTIPPRFVIATCLALLVAVPTSALCKVGDVSYARMAPLGSYLITDRQAEIVLAQSAAPPAISLHATVLVLGRRGYETAQTGTNGFTCLVERSWMSPFDSAEFWNAKIRGPICYNAAASRSILTYTLKRTDRVISGQSRSEMLRRIRAAAARTELPPPAVGSMSYMLSKRGYLGDGAGAWMPHLMFYARQADAANGGASWGANVPRSPVVLDTSHHIVPEPETVFMVPVARWSDGTAARM